MLDSRLRFTPSGADRIRFSKEALGPAGASLELELAEAQAEVHRLRDRLVEAIGQRDQAETHARRSDAELQRHVRHRGAA